MEEYKPDLSTIPVKDGGLHITDFDDLKIAFLELLDKHNKLAASYHRMCQEQGRLHRALRDDIPYGS